MVCAVVFLTGSAQAQEFRAVEDLAEVGIFEHLEQQVPMDLQFQNHAGKDLVFADLFKNGKPAILTLNYASCPMLCNLQLTGLVNALNQLDEVGGKDFNIITVSINPEEQAAEAAEVRFSYLEKYDSPGADWNFLIGQQAPITQLAEAVGFGYHFIPEQDEFAHTAALILLTPEGKVARYLYGIDYDPETLRLSLLETEAGEVKSSLDRLILYCFAYDATKGRYAPAIMNLTRVGGALTIVVLGAFIVRLMRKAAANPENIAA